jgi:hypothetical protein
MPDSLKINDFAPHSRFWNTWMGRIVRAIVLNDAYTRDAILKATNLKEEELNKALKELFQEKLVEEKEEGKLWANKELYGKCKSFFEESQEALVSWVNEWRKKVGNEPTLDPNPSHFYLADRFLSRFSESLIEQAKQEILVTSPFVRRCNISEALTRMSKKGVCVKLVTRGIQSEQFKRELTKGVFVTYDESIHAKLIVVDRRVGIVSSMNFYAGSSAGESWEAGIATTDKIVVGSITQCIHEKFLSASVR